MRSLASHYVDETLHAMEEEFARRVSDFLAERVTDVLVRMLDEVRDFVPSKPETPKPPRRIVL